MGVKLFANEAWNSKIMGMVDNLVPGTARKSDATADVANNVEMEKVDSWLRRVGRKRDVNPEVLQRTRAVAAREHEAANGGRMPSAPATGRMGKTAQWFGGFNGQDYVLSSAALRTGGTIAGVAGAVDIGSRITGGGGVFRDNEGNFDIAGIPFI